MKIVTAVLAGILLATVPAASQAAQQCRDAHGKFIKCLPPVVKPVQCRDPHNGRFVKCPPATPPKGPCRDPKTGRFIKCK